MRFVVLLALPLLLSSCVVPSEETLLPAKARLRRHAVVQSVLLRNGHVVEFDSLGAKMNVQCVNTKDTTCIGGMALNNERVVVPFDSLSQVTLATEKLDMPIISGMALLGAAVIASVWFITQQKSHF